MLKFSDVLSAHTFTIVAGFVSVLQSDVSVHTLRFNPSSSTAAAHIMVACHDVTAAHVCSVLVWLSCPKTAILQVTDHLLKLYS